MANKSYNDIVSTAKLIGFSMERTSKDDYLWVEVWEDEDNVYRALFPPDSDSWLPITYITKAKNDNS